jgi:hypothetical protein
MRPTPPSTRRPLAERVYAWWLHAYPRAHRHAYGQLMLQAFRDSYRDTLVTEGTAGVGFWLAVASDEARSLVREHCATLGDHAAWLRAQQQRLAAYAWAWSSSTDLLGGVSVYLATCGR